MKWFRKYVYLKIDYLVLYKKYLDLLSVVDNEYWEEVEL